MQAHYRFRAFIGRVDDCDLRSDLRIVMVQLQDCLNLADRRRAVKAVNLLQTQFAPLNDHYLSIQVTEF